MNTTISFTTHDNQMRQGAKSDPCIGYITHNGTLGGDALAEALAQKTGYTKIQAKAFLEALSDVIMEGVSSGQIINFGPFRLELSLNGTFPSANAPFDPEENYLEVYAVPSKRFAAAIRALAPVNATPMSKPQLNEISCASCPKKNEIALGEKVVINGANIKIDVSRTDEGIWLEDNAGGRLVKGEIVETENARAVCVFAASSVAKGKYRLVLYTRVGGAPSGQVASAHRNVTVVG